MSNVSVAMRLVLNAVRWRVARRAYATGAVGGARFSDQHEWARREADSPSEITVGVSSWAQEALGEVVFAQLPEVGARVAEGEACGALESVKAASEVYSPIGGVVTASNADVSATPSLINKDCYGAGWLFRLKPDDDDRVNRLMTEAQYLEFLKKDAH